MKIAAPLTIPRSAKVSTARAPLTPPCKVVARMKAAAGNQRGCIRMGERFALRRRMSWRAGKAKRAGRTHRREERADRILFATDAVLPEEDAERRGARKREIADHPERRDARHGPVFPGEFRRVRELSGHVRDDGGAPQARAGARIRAGRERPAIPRSDSTPAHAESRIIGSRPKRSTSAPAGTLTTSAANIPLPIATATAARGAPSAVRASGIVPMGMLSASSNNSAETTSTA